MKPNQIKSLVKTLREQGVTHYKTDDLELILLPLEPTPKDGPLPLKDVSQETKPEDTIPHVVTELTSIMKISDEDLVDRMFPLPEKEPEEDNA